MKPGGNGHGSPIVATVNCDDPHPAIGEPATQRVQIPRDSLPAFNSWRASALQSKMEQGDERPRVCGDIGPSGSYRSF